MNARDAFDDWRAAEPAALHNLTIAEIWQAAYEQGRKYQLDREQERLDRIQDAVDALTVRADDAQLARTESNACDG